MSSFKDKFSFKGICNVENLYNFYYTYLLNKLNTLFVWENLPDTVDVNFLNSTLFLDGIVAWFKTGGDLYALNCGWGGGPNEYYVPTKVIIANPVLGSKELDNGKDAVVMINSSTDQYFATGLRPLIEQYATLLADNLVSINCAQINSRVQAIGVADSAALKNSAELAMKQLYAGKPYTVLEQDLIDKITINPLNTSAKGQISELIELHNYILANFYKSVGVMDNEVSKKERLITDEVDSQKSSVNVNIWDMLAQRVKAIEKINELFGTNIIVKINPIMMSVYEDRTEEIQDEADVLEPKEDAVKEAIDEIDGNKDIVDNEGNEGGDTDGNET